MLKLCALQSGKSGMQKDMQCMLLLPLPSQCTQPFSGISSPAPLLNEIQEGLGRGESKDKILILNVCNAFSSYLTAHNLSVATVNHPFSCFYGVEWERGKKIIDLRKCIESQRPTASASGWNWKD